MRWLATLIAVLALAHRPAHACSYEPGEKPRLPAVNAAGVPLNTTLWGPTTQAGHTVLSHGQQDMDLQVPCVFKGNLSVCTPDRLLEPLTTYRVEGRPFEFTTGEAVDVEAPPQPEELGRRYWVSGPSVAFPGDTCGGRSASGAVTITLSGEGDLLLVDASGSSDTSNPLDHVTVLTTNTHEPGGTVVVIDSTRLGVTGGVQPGDSFPLRVGSMDVAGNFSGWRQLEEAHIPLLPTPGCQASGSVPGWLVLVGLGLLSARRKPGHTARQ